MNVKGKTVLITGAAQGLGEAMALAFAQGGARVALSDLHADAVQETAQRIAAQTGALTLATAVDVGLSSDVASWLDHVQHTWGRVDVLVNNAGIQLNRASEEITDDEWERVLRVDLDGVFYSAREAGRQMMAGGGGGAIINVSSVATRFGLARRLPYGVAKSGVEALTRVLASEWAAHGIRVNAVAPGYVETELNRFAFAQGHIVRPEIEAKIPLGRLAVPKEIADVAVFLASDSASYMTGQTLFVDGGYTVLK